MVGYSDSSFNDCQYEMKSFIPSFSKSFTVFKIQYFLLSKPPEMRLGFFVFLFWYEICSCLVTNSVIC